MCDNVVRDRVVCDNVFFWYLKLCDDREKEGGEEGSRAQSRKTRSPHNDAGKKKGKHITERIQVPVHNQSIPHRIHGAAIYGAPWIPSTKTPVMLA